MNYDVPWAKGAATAVETAAIHLRSEIWQSSVQSSATRELVPAILSLEKLLKHLKKEVLKDAIPF